MLSHWETWHVTEDPKYSFESQVIDYTRFTLMRFKSRFSAVLKPQETASMSRRTWRNRINRSQDVNRLRSSARQPQPFAHKNISRTAENRGLNRISVKGVLGGLLFYQSLIIAVGVRIAAEFAGWYVLRSDADQAANHVGQLLSCFLAPLASPVYTIFFHFTKHIDSRFLNLTSRFVFDAFYADVLSCVTVRNALWQAIPSVNQQLLEVFDASNWRLI